MSYSACYYHVVWATKNRDTVIMLEMLDTIIGVIKAKSGKLYSPICAINGMPDHIHVAVKISVTTSVSEWVKQIKGTSSYVVNQPFAQRPILFRWQRSYGIRTFGERHLEFVASYIRHQQRRHDLGRIIRQLEPPEED